MDTRCWQHHSVLVCMEYRCVRTWCRCANERPHASLAQRHSILLAPLQVQTTWRMVRLWCLQAGALDAQFCHARMRGNMQRPGQKHGDRRQQSHQQRGVAWRNGAKAAVLTLFMHAAFGTSVGAKTLKLWHACIIAAVFEFLGFLTLGGTVTATIAQDISSPELYHNYPGSSCHRGPRLSPVVRLVAGWWQACLSAALLRACRSPNTEVYMYGMLVSLASATV